MKDIQRKINKKQGTNIGKSRNASPNRKAKNTTNVPNELRPLWLQTTNQIMNQQEFGGFHFLGHPHVCKVFNDVFAYLVNSCILMLNGHLSIEPRNGLFGVYVC